MKILITGSRDWDDIDAVIEVLSQYQSDTVLIHGACRGADQICEAVATLLNFKTVSYPADWKQHGHKAGPIRNQQMIDCESPIDLCIAFHDDIKSSKGTRDMVQRAINFGISVKFVQSSRTLATVPT